MNGPRQCNECKQVLKSRGTEGLKTHLKKKHYALYQQHEQQLNTSVIAQHNDQTANPPATPNITSTSSSSSVVSNLPLLSDNDTPASSSTSDRTLTLKKQKLTHYTQPTLLSMIVD